MRDLYRAIIGLLYLIQSFNLYYLLLRLFVSYLQFVLIVLIENVVYVFVFHPADWNRLFVHLLSKKLELVLFFVVLWIF